MKIFLCCLEGMQLGIFKLSHRKEETVFLHKDKLRRIATGNMINSYMSC